METLSNFAVVVAVVLFDDTASPALNVIPLPIFVEPTSDQLLPSLERYAKMFFPLRTILSHCGPLTGATVVTDATPPLLVRAMKLTLPFALTTSAAHRAPAAVPSRSMIPATPPLIDATRATIVPLPPSV